MYDAMVPARCRVKLRLHRSYIILPQVTLPYLTHHCNDTDFAPFGNVRYISVTRTSCFTIEPMAA